MTYWVSVGASRIHTWLAATPELRYLRGASAAIRVHTQPSVFGEAWTAANPGLAGVIVQEKESAVDGVVVLTAPDKDQAARTASAVVDELSVRLPGLSWQAWWAMAESYAEAARAASGSSPTSAVGRLTSLPPVQDNSLVRACPQCRREAGRAPAPASAGKLAYPAGDQVGTERGEDASTHGADCQVRFDHNRPDAAGVPRPGVLPLLGAGPAADFDTLARKGGIVDDGVQQGSIGRRDSRNHLATIVADGNGMGALFAKLANSTDATPEHHHQAVAALNDCTRNAVIDADNAIGSGRAATQATIVHYIGGDDILVSVPAPFAWRFATALASAFELRLRTELQEALGGLKDLQEVWNALSLGVGVTFAHSSHPFADTRAAAERAMRVAKKRGKGRSSWIGWRDLTADNDPVLSQVFDIDLATASAQLNGSAPRVTVFGVSAAARAYLAAILRDVDERARPQAIRDWGARQGIDVAPLLEEPRTLPADLSRARWWSGLPLDGTDGPGTAYSQLIGGAL